MNNSSLTLQWINVNKEIPLPYMTVLLSFKGEGRSSLRTGYWDGASWIIHGNYPILTKEINYWAHLPQPPCAN